MATAITAIAILGVCIGILLMAVRIVVGWVSKPAGDRVERAVTVAGSTFLKLAIVAAGACIAYVFWLVATGSGQ